jgi:hypothetical protein
MLVVPANGTHSRVRLSENSLPSCSRRTHAFGLTLMLAISYYVASELAQAEEANYGPQLVREMTSLRR